MAKSHSDGGLGCVGIFLGIIFLPLILVGGIIYGIVVLISKKYGSNNKDLNKDVPFFDHFNHLIQNHEESSIDHLSQNRCESPIEELFWEIARERIPGLIPQYTFGSYRIDFALPQRRIAIELDGHEYHKTKEQRTNDAIRERNLQEMGWTVIRFTGTEIHQNVNRCISQAIRIIGQNLANNDDNDDEFHQHS